MNSNKMNANERVDLLRGIPSSYQGQEVYIPENDVGISKGYYSVKDLLYFFADMIEE